MKKHLTFIYIILLFASCTKSEPKVYTAQEAKRKSDSILAKKKLKIAKEAQKDLDLRKAVEVKIKIDSITKKSHQIPQAPVFGGNR